MARKQYCHLVGVQNVTFSAPPPDLSTYLSQQMDSAEHYHMRPEGLFHVRVTEFWKQVQRIYFRFLDNALHQSCDVGTCIPTLPVGESQGSGLSN